MRLGLLCSGGLGLIALEKLQAQHGLVFAATDSASRAIAESCALHQIPLFCGNPRKGALASFLQANQLQVDLILSVNYLFLIEADVLHCAGQAVNFHGSLLPRYRGRTPHVWAIIHGEKQTGVSAHLIHEGCDTGDIVLQETVDISRTDTGASILERFQELYPGMIDRVIELFQAGALQGQAQDHSQASYYPKRTPEDGHIDWNWERERIYNWVRAQSHPYPGAFAFYEGQKVIIDWLEPCECEWDPSIPNGTLLAVSPYPVVKTPDGGVKLTRCRQLPQPLEVGQSLS